MAYKADIDLKALLKAGAHFGHKTSRWNPKMAQYIFGSRGGIHIIDLVKTGDKLADAAGVAYELGKTGKILLFTGTKFQSRDIVRKAAEDIKAPFVVERWLGGMLTNFQTMEERIKRLKKLEEQLENGELAANYKKREVLEFKEEIARLRMLFGGIADMEKAPDAIFAVSIPSESVAIKEANTLHIPVIAIADTNTNPELVKYAIPANDDAIKSIELIVTMIADAYNTGRTEYLAKAKDNEEKAAKADAKSKEAEAKPSRTSKKLAL